MEYDGTIDAVEVKHAAMRRHLLITAIGRNVNRMIPPLIVTKEQCDEAAQILKESVEEVAGA